MPGFGHPDEVVRSRSHEIYCLGVAAVCAIFVVGGLVVAAGRANPGPQIGLAVVFLLLAGAAVKWSRCCVVFAYSRDALIVRNPLRTYTMTWSDIDGFDVRQSWFAGPQGQRRTLVDLKRTDGSRITCVGACPLGGTAALNMRVQLDDAYRRRK